MPTPDRAEPVPGARADVPGRRALAALGVVGALLLASSWLALGTDRAVVPAAEADVFAAFNGLPDAAGVVLLPVMQLGAFSVGAVGVAGWYALTRRARPAVAALVALVLSSLTSTAIKHAVARGRPADLLDGVDLRMPGVDGYGYTSGHTTTACALATVAWALLPPRWRLVPWALAAVVGLARMHYGVHLPLDVVGGAGLGILCGLAALVVTGTAPRPR